MGRARIIHNYGEGKYAIEVSLDVSRIQRERDKLSRQIAELEPTLPGLAATYDLARLEYEQTYAEMIVAIQVGAGTDAQKNKQLAVLSKKLVEQGRRMLLAGHAYDSARLKLLCLQSRLSELNDLPAARNVDAWCADYSDELEIGTIVGTIDVARQNFEYNRDWVFRPCYGQTTYYDPKRDGILQDTEAATPAAAFLNFALNPGVSKWMPRYRVATVTAVYPETDRVDVDLRAAYTARFDVNQTERLEQVPVTYMDCNAAVFEEGDDVVVWFNGNDWNDPYVIGFEHDPKFLAPYIRITVSGYNRSWHAGGYSSAPGNPEGIPWESTERELAALDPEQDYRLTCYVFLDARTGELAAIPGLSNPCTKREFDALYTSRDATTGYLNSGNADYVVNVSDVRMLGYEPGDKTFFSEDLINDPWMGFSRGGVLTDIVCSADNARICNALYRYPDSYLFEPPTTAYASYSSNAREFYEDAYDTLGYDFTHWGFNSRQTGANNTISYSKTFPHAGTASTLNARKTFSAELKPGGEHWIRSSSLRMRLNESMRADNRALSEPFEVFSTNYSVNQDFDDDDDYGYYYLGEKTVTNKLEFDLSWQSLGGQTYSVKNTIEGEYYHYGKFGPDGKKIERFDMSMKAEYCCAFFRQAAACGLRGGSCSVAIGISRPLTIELGLVGGDPLNLESRFDHGSTDVTVEVMFSPEKLAQKTALRGLPAAQAAVQECLNRINYERTYTTWRRDNSSGGYEYRNACNLYPVGCSVHFVTVKPKT